MAIVKEIQHNNLFAEATRIGLTVETGKGAMNVIRLWQLSLEELNTLAKGLNKKLKAAEDEEDFISRTSLTKEQALDSARLEILKYIINYKLTEKALVADKKEKSAKKAVLLGALAELENAELKSKSKAEILAELDALGNA